MSSKAPDHDIEQFWLGMKDSMKKFYNDLSIVPRPIDYWSDKLNRLQSDKNYKMIEKNILKYISLYALDMMRNNTVIKTNYHVHILVTNIKRWNKLSLEYSFTENTNTEYFKRVSIFLHIYNNLLSKKKIISNELRYIFSQIELYIFDNDYEYEELIKYSVKNNKPVIIDNLYKITNILPIINRLYNLDLKIHISGKKLVRMV